jgi:predicted XRE-type DNA-binding protein
MELMNERREKINEIIFAECLKTRNNLVIEVAQLLNVASFEQLDILTNFLS